MKTLFKISLLCSIGFTAQYGAAHPADVQASLNNFNQHCVRDLPEAILNAKQLTQYKFYYEVVPETRDATPMPQAIEIATTAKKVPFKFIQSGCEFINQELIITLPSSVVEKNGRFCASCAIEAL